MTTRRTPRVLNRHPAWAALLSVPALLATMACDPVPPGGECAGLTGAACGIREFCNFAPDALCGAADQTGTCEPIPEVCTFEFVPVCGCDDRTYANACTANAAGVSVASEGECEDVSGRACGGLQGLACGEGEFCNFAPDALCGAADQTGTCTPIPEGCTLQFDPVCGCDDRTYGNACAANAEGVSVASRGECP
jgi:hypothetical protein